MVKRTGDGSLVESRSAVDAASRAIEVQDCLIERNAGVPPERRLSANCHTPLLRSAMTALRVRRDKAALSGGCEPHPANAPAGSNRSSHGGDEMADAFGVAGHK